MMNIMSRIKMKREIIYKSLVIKKEVASSINMS